MGLRKYRSMTTTFKNTTKDLALWEVLEDMEDRGLEVKRVLYKYFVLGLKFEVGKEPVQKREEENPKEVDNDKNINILDF